MPLTFPPSSVAEIDIPVDLENWLSQVTNWSSNIADSWDAVSDLLLDLLEIREGPTSEDVLRFYRVFETVRFASQHNHQSLMAFESSLLKRLPSGVLEGLSADAPASHAKEEPKQ